MSIETEITRLVEAKQAFSSWLTSKNIQVPSYALLGDLVGLLSQVGNAGQVTVTTENVSVNAGGEVLVQSGVQDWRDIEDGFVCCFLCDEDNGRLMLLNQYFGHVYNSSLNIDLAALMECTRLELDRLYWCVDPDLSIFSAGQSISLTRVWRGQ